MTDPAAPLRIVLADDERMVRTALRAILAAEPDLEIVGEAATGAEAVSVVRERTPDVVLMDVRMPRVDGIETTRQISLLAEPSRMLVLTTFDLDEYVYEAIRAGAARVNHQHAVVAHRGGHLRVLAAGDVDVRHDDASDGAQGSDALEEPPVLVGRGAHGRAGRGRRRLRPGRRSRCGWP